MQLEARNADLASQVIVWLCMSKRQLSEGKTSFHCVSGSAGCSISHGEGPPPAAVRAGKVRGGGNSSIQVLSSSGGRGESLYLPLAADPRQRC